MENLDLKTVLTGKDPAPDYLVTDLYHKGQLIVIAGEPGVGKSFLQYHIAMCLASGLDILGRHAENGKVLYFDEENSRRDLNQYLRWIWRGLDRPDVDILDKNLFIGNFLLTQQGKNRFTYMADCAREIKPALMVLDTVTPCCGILDENDNAQASIAIRALRYVKEAAGPDATMILLKHAKFTHDVEERQTIRGAKTWLGECDHVIYHKACAGKPRTDGLRNSRLVPDKTRAFGLRKELVIVPHWIGKTDDDKGIELS